MKSDDIITYCLDNYGYVDCVDNQYGQELLYSQNNISIFFLHIQEFDTDDDKISNLNHPDKYRLSLRLSKNEFNKLFSKLCLYDEKYICYTECDYTKPDIVMPHPLKSKEYYIQCINPSKDIFEKVLKELISISYKCARQEYLLKR